MSSDFGEIPRWASRALQGITYWIGHRRCLYRNYPLGESAIVAEICNLIYANLSDQDELTCEIQYTDLIRGKATPTILTGRARADLVIADQSKTAPEIDPKFIIEVKRATAARAQVDLDLRRLAEAHSRHPTARTFLFVVAEAGRPKRFVTELGASVRGMQTIPETRAYFRVRRTWKAAHAYSNILRRI